MAHYQHAKGKSYLIEQNIWDDGELESYEAKNDTPEGVKTAALCFFEDYDGVRYYALYLLENVSSPNIKVVSSDLAGILKFKTAKTRRKHLLKLIEEFEAEKG